jgi:transglutaminase-like putative cysteine protease
MIMSATQPTSSLVPTGLRALIVAAGFWVLSMPLTTTAGSIAAVLGCVLANFLVDRNIHRSPLRELRQSVIVLAALLLMFATGLLAAALTRSGLGAQLIGPMPSYQLGQILQWLVAALALTAVMRIFAHRYSWGKVLEVLFVAGAFVIALAAHRQGMIHRPYFIGDFALIRGIDPSSILMIIGCAAVLSLSALLMAERNHRRLPYHFTALGLLCFSLLLYVQFIGMPSPRLTNDLGLTGQASNAEGRQQESDNPFRDGENDPADREAPVAIVVFRDDYEPAEGIYYFRESAYSEFNGNMLATATNPALDRDLVREFPRTEVVVEEDIPARDQRRAVRTTIGLLTPHRSPFGLDAPLSYTNVANPNSLRFRQTYDVVSLVPEFGFPDLLARDAGSPDWTLAQWQEYLAMPDDPRYGEFAQELVSNLRPEFATDPYAKAQAVKSWLDENGIYSLANEHAYASDPAASFLFGDLTGYCVHFAYAATYMYRALGIPARVAVGYAVPAQNRAGGSALLIQAVNGHAWPEIYLQDIGWVIVDPSPLQSLVDMSVDPQDALQQLLGDMLRDDAALEEFMLSQQSSRISLATLLRIIYSSLLALLLAAWLVRIWRQQAPRIAGNGADLHRLAYRAALDTLSAYGHNRRFGESREAFARRMSTCYPAFAIMSQTHLQLALGRPGDSLVASVPPAQTAQYWQQQRRALQNELRQQHSPWLRLLALLDPVPWLRSR